MSAKLLRFKADSGGTPYSGLASSDSESSLYDQPLPPSHRTLLHPTHTSAHSPNVNDFNKSGFYDDIEHESPFMGNIWTLTDLPANSLSNLKGVCLLMYASCSNFGFLLIPFAFYQSSWYSFGALLLVSLSVFYTSFIIGETLEQASKVVLGYGNISSYPALAYHSGGRFLLLLSHFLFFLETLGVSIIFFLVEITCAQGLVKKEGVSTPGWEVLFSVSFVILFTSLVDLPFYFRLGFFSAIVLILTLSSEVIEYASIEKIYVDNSDLVTSLLHLPVTFSIILYSFQFPRLIPQLKSALLDTQAFPAVLKFGFSFCTVFFAAIGGFGLLVGNMSVNRFEIFPFNITSEKKAPTMLSALFVALLIATISQHGDVVRSCQHSLTKLMTKDEFEEEEDEDDLPLSYLAMLYSVRIGVGAVAFAVAFFTPNKIAWVAAFISIICGFSLLYIIPCIMYLRMNHFSIPEFERKSNNEGLSLCSRLTCYAIILAAVVLSIWTGYYAGLSEMVFI